MDDMISISGEKLMRLEDRARNLAQEKSYLQLVNNSMNDLTSVPGLENTVEAILRIILNALGGSNVALYYLIDSRIHYADVYGEKKILEAVSDDVVQRAFEEKVIIEELGEFGHTKMITPEFTKASYWAFPFTVGEKTIGVLKMEGMLMATAEIRTQFQPFFSYAALVLKNEIESYSKLMETYDRLRKTNEDLRKSEDALSRANQYLEERVAERTAELQKANEQLHLELRERKRAEEALRRLNRELRAISSCNQILVRAEDEQILLNDICRIICDDAGYRMAWVGYAENDEGRTIRPVTWAGVEDGYLEKAKLTWADGERGRGPTGTAIRSGQSAFIHDFATEPQAAPWRENALQCGYRSSVALPLKDERARTFGVLNIYSAEPHAFTPEEIRLMGELAADLAFGIVVLRNRIERKQVEDVLRINEERYRKAQAMGHVGNWEYNLQTNYFWGSDEAKRIYGFDPEHVDFSADEVENCIPERERVHQALVDLIETDKAYNLEFEIRPRNSSEPRIIASIAELQRDEYGEPLRVVGVIQDITERKQAEDKLRKLNEELEERVKERTAELERKNRELERLNRVFAGRELRMVELKKKIAELEKAANRG